MPFFERLESSWYVGDSVLLAEWLESSWSVNDSMPSLLLLSKSVFSGIYFDISISIAWSSSASLPEPSVEGGLVYQVVGAVGSVTACKNRLNNI